jgi:cytochrome P450
MANMARSPAFHLMKFHRQDPAHHQTIYRVGTKFTKDPASYPTSFGSSLSMFTTQGKALHRARCSVLAPLFTRARVLELEHIVQNNVSKLCKRMQELLASSLSGAYP